MARTTNKAESLLTFSRASSGTALTKVVYGPELVTNGDFSAGTTGWSENLIRATASIVSGRLRLDATDLYGYTYQGIATEIGETYVLEYSMFDGTADAHLRIGTTAGNFEILNITADTSNGSTIFVAQSTTTFIAPFVNTVSGGVYSEWGPISVKKVTYNSPTGTLKLISHPTNKPRVEYDASGVVKGLLLEGARTNLVTDSLVFTSAPGAQGITVTSSSETAPDGTTSASLCTATGTGIHRVRNSVTVTASGVTYSTSVFVKNVDADYIQINNSGDLQYYANFDLVNGVVGTTGSKTTSTITAYPNGWYRITASYDGTGVMNAVINIVIVTSASAPYSDGANKPGTQVHMWGLQREQGSFATSYIPTSGATATRSADIASVSVNTFGYRDVEGTVIVDFGELKSVGATADYFIISTNNTFNPQSYGVFANGITSTNYYRRLSSAYNPAAVSAAPAPSECKMSLSFDSTTLTCAINGTLASTAISGTATGVTEIRLLVSGVTGVGHSGYVKSIKYYPVRLDDDKLKELTL